VRKLFGAGEGTDGFVDRAFSRRTRFLTGDKLGLMWME
jgi:hypothetical protein